MRIAGLIIGVIGSIAGFIGAVVALAIGGIGEVIEAEGSRTVTTGAIVAIAASIVGLVGAVLSMAKPRLAAGLMLGSAIVGIIAVFVAYILATILLIIASLLTFLGRDEKRNTQPPSGA